MTSNPFTKYGSKKKKTILDSKHEISRDKWTLLPLYAWGIIEYTPPSSP